ncbi:PREDICTED: zinc finger protein 831 [Elephantulus edwardii]|uniref:zinc finger protein 831 n=1 Tax=Elephantulus edwardii TaxID=28737 RepID=UPI0003F0D525|nr:PREDICTED: zinc finger protein 831 [Elephantulus edwardii]
MKAVVGGTAPCLLPEKPSDALPLESTENTLLEIPASSPNNSHHVEGRHETFLPSWGQCECGGNGNKKDQGAGSATSKDCLGSASPERPPGILGAPSKTTKKRGLEGVRKQTQVELSDTSSDDEDRLVIEEI